MYFTALLFTTMADVQIGFVPYRGTALVANDLIGGHIGLGIVDPPPSQAAFATAASRASRFHRAALPLLPRHSDLRRTGAEGLRGQRLVRSGRAGGDFPGVIARLNAAVVAALKDPEVVERIHHRHGAGAVNVGRFAARIDREIDKISKVLAKAGGSPK